MTHILIIRFSSIGDIVLTTPVIRCIKQQIPHAIIHFATKESYAHVLQHNPYIDHVHLLGKQFASFKKTISQIPFDVVVDLHHNLRSFRLKWNLKGTHLAYDKLHVQKWLAVKTRQKKHLPNKHLVDRYFEALAPISVTYDGKGLDYFEGNPTLPESVNSWKEKPYVVIAIGGQHGTKKMPGYKWVELIQSISRPIIILGGFEDKPQAEWIIQQCPHLEIYHYCGSFSLHQSALVVKHCHRLFTHDTGLMHIGAAYNKPIYSIWGSTIPEFGMYPFFASDSTASSRSSMIQNQQCSCRPCSKIGFSQCPLQHFACMTALSFDSIDLNA
jgi:ADP-heptose:LPS heptosyltransferase